MRESLIFYQSFARAIKKLPESEQLKALWSIIDYALEDKEPDGDSMYIVVYEMAKPQIDANVGVSETDPGEADRQKYQRNRRSRKNR